MRFMLDTDICIYIIKKKPLNVWRKFQELSLGEVGVSTITVAELQYGVYKSQHQAKNKMALTQFLLPLKIIPFDEKATEIYGKIRAKLEQQGQVIGAMDMLIAAQAISLEITLLTNNTDEFSRIPELTIQNWTE
jgi:tRNA(fMet)-specific endonuclease VapC